MLISRDDWIRTSDPYVPNVVRYRAALHPDPGEDCKNNKATCRSQTKKPAIAKAKTGWSGRLDSN